ncbi:hypothetical protein ACFW04_013899 [Cataglyphis niger]
MFFRYTRMTVDTFYILEMVFSKFQKHNWKVLAPELRLSVTLKYNQQHAIIKEIIDAIVNVLLPRFVQPPSKIKYNRITPSRSDSLYYNYKKTFNIVLMAVCDHNYKFTLVDVGSYGSQNDANISNQNLENIKKKEN